MSRKLPAIRRHATGQAVVSLSCARTKRRRDFYLGVHGTDASIRRHARLIANYLDAGRVLDAMTPDEKLRPSAISCMDLAHAYWHRRVQGNYARNHALTLRHLIEGFTGLAGDLPVDQVGPRLLQLWRDTEIQNREWSRSYANVAVSRIRGMFRWGVAQEMVPATVLTALDALEPLRAGSSLARETRGVQPVGWDALEATLPHLGRQTRALVRLQHLTGARAGELVIMRPGDIDRTGEVWLYRPATHKNAHRGKERVIPLGPQAQRVLFPFLARPDDAYLFSPKEATDEFHATRTAARQTPASCGNRAGENLADNPQRGAGDRYTTDSYRQAIWRACDRAFPPPQCLSPAAMAQWRKDHRWNPHQIRHARADFLARRFDSITASKVLGHSDAEITQRVYMTRDLDEIVRVAREVG